MNSKMALQISAFEQEIKKMVRQASVGTHRSIVKAKRPTS
jgi:hypothetical protein